MLTRNRLIWLGLILVAAAIAGTIYYKSDPSQIRTKILPNYQGLYSKQNRNPNGEANLKQGNEFDDDDNETGKTSPSVDKGKRKDEPGDDVENRRQELDELKSELSEKEQKLKTEKRKLEEEKAKVDALKAALTQQRNLLEEERNKMADDRAKLTKAQEDIEKQKQELARRVIMPTTVPPLPPGIDPQKSQMAWLGMTPSEITAKYPEIVPMENYKLRPFVDPSDPNAIGLENRPQTIQDMTGDQAENRFYTLVNMEHISCTNTRRMGNFQDGGWDMCISAPYTPVKNNCLVYSFGINNDWSFDDAISREYGCQVKAFDPSMGVGDHAHSSKVYFYNLGLGERDETNPQGWKLNSLKTILHNLGHDNKVIDFLKIDIEFNEWSSFRSMIKDGVLRNIKQFAFEIHTLELSTINRQSQPSDFLGWYNELLDLEKQGFRRFHHHHNPFGNYYSSRTNKQRTCCYELYYININFLRS